MPLYSLEGRRPMLPAEGEYWIAPDAASSATSGSDATSAYGSARFCAATTSRSSSARAATFRTSARCTPTWAPRSRSARTAPIGHNAILHGCTIGDGSLIGMGAVVLNGARIGRGCLVGRAGAGDGGQDLSRPFADRRLAGQGGPHARRRGDRRSAQLRRTLCPNLAALRFRTASIRPGGAAGRQHYRTRSALNASAGFSRANSTATPFSSSRTTMRRSRADHDALPERRPGVDRHRRAGARDVDQSGGELAPICELDRRVPIARLNALVAPVFPYSHQGAIGEPSQLIGKFVAFGLRQLHPDGEPAEEHARDISLECDRDGRDKQRCARPAARRRRTRARRRRATCRASCNRIRDGQNA